MPSPMILETADHGVRGTVLGGIARGLVLDACDQLGITVLHQPPDPRQRALWREAFLTNVVRLVQPVSQLTWVDAQHEGFPETFELPSGTVEAGGVTARIREHVLGAMLLPEQLSPPML